MAPCAAHAAAAKPPPTVIPLLRCLPCRPPAPCSQLADSTLGILAEQGAGPGGAQFVMNIKRAIDVARTLELKGVVRWAGGRVAGWATDLGCVQQPAHPDNRVACTAREPRCTLTLPHLPACVRTACSVCRSKFGSHGMRIWNMLFSVGQLEQKQVAELSMLPKDEAREKLYAMLKAG